MSKAKTAGEKATASAETVLENGAVAMKTGLEKKTLKGYRTRSAELRQGDRRRRHQVGYCRRQEHGAHRRNSEIYSYSKQSIEDAVTATKAVLEAKSIHRSV